MEKYYKILGVDSNASQEEIRRKYRKLVMRYHPDKNPSKQAAQQFLLIKEAYEIVTGKIPPPRVHSTRKSAQRAQPTTNTNSSGSSQRKTKTEAERVKAARNRYQEQKMREDIENERYFRRLTTGKRWKRMKLLAIIGLIAGMGMIADRLLPRHYVADRVVSYDLNRAYSFDGKSLSVVKTNSGNYFWVANVNYILYSKAPDVYVEKTWLFHDPVQLIARDKIEYAYFPVHFTHYRHYIVLFLFFLPCFVLWYKRRTIFFTMLFLSSYYGVGLILIYYLVSGDRWAHLLTLGFL